MRRSICPFTQKDCPADSCQIFDEEAGCCSIWAAMLAIKAAALEIHSMGHTLTAIKEGMEEARD